MHYQPHPDEQLFATYAAPLLAAMTSAKTPTTPNGQNLDLYQIAATAAGLFADAMVAEHRKRFPIPEQDLQFRPGPMDPSMWCRLDGQMFPRGRFGEIIIEGSYPMQQHMGRANREKYASDLFDSPFPPKITDLHAALRHGPDRMGPGQVPTLATFEALIYPVILGPVPQWIRDVVASDKLTDQTKVEVFNAVATMVHGRGINLHSGSIKGAFAFKDAPNGPEFWGTIAAFLPPVVDDMPDVNG